MLDRHKSLHVSVSDGAGFREFDGTPAKLLASAALFVSSDIYSAVHEAAVREILYTVLNAIDEVE